MASELLAEILEKVNARKLVRLEAAIWVLNHPKSMPELLYHCFKINDEKSYKASWVLEIVCLEKLELLYPYLDVFFENLHKVDKDQTLRPMAKICEMLSVAYYILEDPKLLAILNAAHKETMTSCCFDWIITPQKVACEVFAMSSLYFLGTEIQWIHTDLKTIIESKIYERSPAYKARGRHVLKRIEKFRYNY